MNYSIVAVAYEAIEKTSKRLKITRLLADLLLKTPIEIIDKMIYLTQGKLLPDFMGIEMGVADKLAIRALAATTARSKHQVEDTYFKIGDIGATAEELLKTKGQSTLLSETLTVKRVYDTLYIVARTSGSGSIDTRIRLISNLLNDASPIEAKYILRTATGRLRLGIADYTVLDALALAYTGDRSNRILLERAYNLSSDLGSVARSLAAGGLESLQKFCIKVGRPVRPMLAERLGTIEAVLEKLGGSVALEYKLDGERVQVHLSSNEAKIFSRQLENITGHYPELVDLCISRLKCENCVIEGEVVAVDANSGDYLPFQELMHRRRKHGVSEALERYPVSINFFDLLYIDGDDMTNLPYYDRRKKLEAVVNEGERIKIVPLKITSIINEAEDFMEEAITSGCEGLVIKDLSSAYKAGARGFAWIKLKREYKNELIDTLDLVIVGAFHGLGRRSGKYGAFLLAAYDTKKDVFNTVSKIGTGFSDNDLNKFPIMLEPHRILKRNYQVISKIKADVWFNPHIVIEVVASEITLSPIHTAEIGSVRKGSGLALRFPKFTGRVRHDKGALDCTTTKEILAMYNSQLKKVIS